LYFTLQDADYWYEVHGEKGIPLVLLHGFTGSTKTWQFFVEQRPEQFQLIVVDLPGHGKTKTKQLKSMEDCCADLKKLFDELGLQKFHLAGYSMGGRTALSFAMFYPESIVSLILESASPGLEEVEERKERVEKDEELARKLETEGIESFVHFWENLPLFATQKHLTVSLQDSIRRGRLAQSASGLAASLRSMGTGQQPSWWHLLGNLKLPVLLLVGELDTKYVELNQKMQAKLSAGEHVVCQDTGHAVHIEDEQLFIDHVVRFITEREDIS